MTLDRIAEAAGQGRITELFHDPVLALGLPALELDDVGAEGIRNGRSVPAPAPTTAAPTGDGALLRAALPPDALVSLTHQGRLLALARVLGDNLVPQVVFPEGLETGAR